jgi:hypothetical protein
VLDNVSTFRADKHRSRRQASFVATSVTARSSLCWTGVRFIVSRVREAGRAFSADPDRRLELSECGWS